MGWRAGVTLGSSAERVVPFRKRFDYAKTQEENEARELQGLRGILVLFPVA